MLLPRPAAGTRVLVATAPATCLPSCQAEAVHDWFTKRGCDVTETDLASVSESALDRQIAASQLVCAAGGNPFLLLHHMRRTNFWAALQRHDPLYVGVCAGTVVAGTDIVAGALCDDRTAAPDLASTAGASLVTVRLMRHADDPRCRPLIDRVRSTIDAHMPLLALADNEAVVVSGREWSIVSSPGSH